MSRRLLVIVVLVFSGFAGTLAVGTSTVAGAVSGATPPGASANATTVSPHLDRATRNAAQHLSPGSSARLGSTVGASASPTTAGIGTVVTFSLTVEDTVVALDPLEVNSFAAVLYPGGGVRPLPLNGCTPMWVEIFMDVTCSWSHVVSAYDSAVGSVTVGMDIGGDFIFHHNLGSGVVKIPVTGSPDLTFTATASPTATQVRNDVVTYTYTITNTGTMSFRSTPLTSGLAGNPTLSCTSPLRYGMAPLSTRTCTAQHRVTAADVAAGSIVDDASVAPTYAGGSTLRNASVTVTTGEHPQMNVTVVASPASGLSVGQTITWVMTATNTGDVTLTDIGKNFPLPGLVVTSCQVSNPFVPGGTASCTGTYTVTQADVDAGSVVNVVTFMGTDLNQRVIQAGGQGTATTVTTPA